MIYVSFNGYGQWRFHKDEVNYRSVPNGVENYHAKGIFSLTDDDENDLCSDDESLKNLESIKSLKV